MTVSMQLVVVFHHSPCCIIIIIIYILSCIECIHVSWCTTVRNKSIIIIINIWIPVSGQTLSFQAFADDVVILATAPGDIQTQFTSVVPGLLCPLTLKAHKCKTLVDGKRKLWVVDPNNFLSTRVGNMIGSLAVGQGYKYLGNLVCIGKVDIACIETKNTPSAFVHADSKDDGIAVPIFVLLTPLLHIRRTSKMARSVDPLVRQVTTLPVFQRDETRWCVPLSM